MTDAPGTNVAADSWAFLLHIYAEPGVADACLLLQEEAHVDVTLLLVTAFAVTERNVAFSNSDIDEIDALCRPWREQIVKPLRALRTTLKSGPPPAPQATDTLRKQIKANELAAERLQSDLLADWLVRKSPCSAPSSLETVRSTLGNVVAAFAEPDTTLAVAAAQALDTIAEAAIRVRR